LIFPKNLFYFPGSCHHQCHNHTEFIFSDNVSVTRKSEKVHMST